MRQPSFMYTKILLKYNTMKKNYNLEKYTETHPSKTFILFLGLI